MQSDSVQNASKPRRQTNHGIEPTPALIHTGRPDGYLDYFNRSWREYTGKSLGELCGWRWTDSVHPEDVAGIIQKWQTSLESGEPFEAEARVRRGDGSYRAFLHRTAKKHFRRSKP